MAHMCSVSAAWKPSHFQDQILRGRQAPFHVKTRATLRTLADASTTAFKMSVAEAQEILGDRPPRAEVSGQDPNLGVRIGEAQNPGPRRRIRHQDTLKVWTFNCGGAKQAWAT